MIHDRKYFYKYLPAETALKILQTRTLKYSSPALFNDPFDSQSKMQFGFEIPEFVGAFSARIYNMIHCPLEPVGDEKNALFRDIKKAWYTANQSQRKMPEKFWRQQLKDFNQETVRLCTEHLEEMNNWWYRLSRATRILCLSEDLRNLLMWAHYAKDHTGVVIQLKCIPELDTSLLAARKVSYKDKPPVIAELNDYLSHLTGQSNNIDDRNALFYELFLTKSSQWCYEKEWRIFIPPFNMEDPTIKTDNKGQEVLFDLISFYPQEIHSIYFGCNISKVNRIAIMKCLEKKDMCHVEKYDCIKSDREYSLEFNKAPYH